MTTVLWIIAAIVIVNILLVTFWYFFREKKEEPSVEQPSETVDEHEPVVDPPSFEESQGEIKPTEPTIEPPVDEPVEPKLNVGDWVVYNGVLSDHKDHLLQIKTIDSNRYEFTDGSTLVASDSDMYLRRWTIQDAKDGDVLVGIDEDFTSVPWIGMFKCINKDYPDRRFDSHCFLQACTHIFCTPETESIYENICVGHSSQPTRPATKEQRDLLFAKMAEAGYMWLSHKKELVKLKFKTGDSVCKKSDGQIYYIDNITENGYFNGITPLFPIECQDDFELVGISEPNPEPVGTEEPTEEEIFEKNIDELLSYFSQVVPVGEKTREYIMNLKVPTFSKDSFPVVYDYYGTKDNELLAGAQGYAWIVGMILSELVPAKRNELMQMAYDYLIKGREQPTYGYTFETDPNIARMLGAVVYAINRDASIIPELRKEVGGSMVTYKNDISELYIDCTKFMPTAPPPFINGYENRPKGTPVDADNTASMDEQINDYVAQYYNLDTKDAEKKRQTIQAIANKEYHKQHLFGKDRTVTDKVYGTMTIHPVFGKHNLGVEIPDDGAIANLVYDMGKICSATRISLLNQEYGRKRPGMGDTDGSMNTDERHRALVNYPIEEGDGHTTGYYDKGGYYVDGNGNYIGDYVTFYQGQLYANSYPSGHSAFIMGVGMLLMEVMPDKADLILKALIEFANGRIICRYHNQSDVIHGLVIGSMMIPVLHATTNYDLDGMVSKAKEEYQRILSGDVTPELTPEPTEKVNTSLAYAIGGYGSCHVDAGETTLTHRCTKQCTKERHPAIQVNQRVEFTIEGGGVTDDNGKTSGVWEANKAYGIKCPAVKEDQIATITMRNENGVKVLEYRCSKDGTHDDGAGEI